MTARKRYKGALHLHTDLSHDGEMSFEHLTSFLKGKGYDFMTITEHSYDVDQATMDRLAEQSRACSTDDFLVIPGLEFRCKTDIDILGLGVYQTLDSEDMATVIDHIHQHNGVAIFAHPGQSSRYAIEPDWVKKLDGAELYNVRQGRLMPQLSSVRWCRTMRDWKTDLNIHFGIDLHYPGGYLWLSNTVSAEENSEASILQALKAGHFKNESRFLNVGSDGKMGPLKLTYVYLFRTLLTTVRRIRDLLHI